MNQKNVVSFNEAKSYKTGDIVLGIKPSLIQFRKDGLGIKTYVVHVTRQDAIDPNKSFMASNDNLVQWVVVGDYFMVHEYEGRYYTDKPSRLLVFFLNSVKFLLKSVLYLTLSAFAPIFGLIYILFDSTSVYGYLGVVLYALMDWVLFREFVPSVLGYLSVLPTIILMSYLFSVSFVGAFRDLSSRMRNLLDNLINGEFSSENKLGYGYLHDLSIPVFVNSWFSDSVDDVEGEEDESD